MTNLYKLSQDVNTGYDTYSDCVVAALSADTARLIHPSCTEEQWWLDDDEEHYNWKLAEWASPNDVKAEYIGVAAPNIQPGQVICASFHAG